MGKVMKISENCVYTIVSGERLKDVINHANNHEFSEKTRWVSAVKLLKEAKEQDTEMPVLFADACDCSRLLYWGFLKDITVTEEGTSYIIKRLYALKGEHKPQELQLLSSGNNIAEGYIRPYAICSTPEFFTNENTLV